MKPKKSFLVQFKNSSSWRTWHSRPTLTAAKRTLATFQKDSPSQTRIVKAVETYKVILPIRDNCVASTKRMKGKTYGN